MKVWGTMTYKVVYKVPSLKKKTQTKAKQINPTGRTRHSRSLDVKSYGLKVTIGLKYAFSLLDCI
jgi:hypothetical protein